MKKMFTWENINLDEKFDAALEYVSSGSLEEHFQAGLVFEELFVNIYNYAYEKKGGGPVMVCMEETPDGMEIILADYGLPFNPIERANWIAKDSEIGGRGIDLIKSYSKQFEYRRSFHANIVRVLV